MRSVVGPRFHRRTLAEPEAVGTLRSELVVFAEQEGASDEVREAIRLAASEALTNAVVHAYREHEDGVMGVEAWQDDAQRLVVRICDEGSGLMPRPGTSGMGLGLGLMAQLADDFRIANREGSPGTVVSMRFALTESTSAIGDLTRRG